LYLHTTMPMLTGVAPGKDFCDEEKVMNQFAQIFKLPFQELLLSKLQGMLLPGQKQCNSNSIIESPNCNSNIDNQNADNVTVIKKQPLPSHNEILDMATAPIDNKYFDNSCKNL